MTGNPIHRFDVLLFGAAAEAVGADRVTVRLPAPTTVDELGAALAAQHPTLADTVRVGQLAVNCALAAPSTVVRGDEELALIAMVSGG